MWSLDKYKIKFKRSRTYTNIKMHNIIKQNKNSFALMADY